MSSVQGRNQVSLLALGFNHEKFLAQFFASLEANQRHLREVILIDNGSSDNTLQLMREYAQNSVVGFDIFIKSNPVGTSVANALNTALEIASEDYISIISCDDYLLPGRFDKQTVYMSVHPEIQFCYSNGYTCDMLGNLTNVPIHDARMVRLLRQPGNKIADELFYPIPALFTQCALFRKKALVAIGGWDENLIIDDWPLNIRLFRAFGSEFKYIDVFVVAYRRHPENASKLRFRQYFGQKQVLERLAKGKYLRNGIYGLYVVQALASIKRRQWRRAHIFIRAGLNKQPALTFVFIGIVNELFSRLASKRIR